MLPPAHAQGTRLRELRAQRGLTQAQLARRAGLSRPFLSTLERGHRHRPDLIPALARALGVTTASWPSTHHPRNEPEPARAGPAAATATRTPWPGRTTDER